MQKPKTQVKYDNLVAQISVLKGELNVVNKELTNKIKERNSLNTGLLSVRKELEKTKQYSSDIQDILLVRLGEFDNKEKTIEERLSIVDEKELALIGKIKVDEKKEKERKRLEVKLLNLVAHIEKDNLLLKVKQDKIDELTKVSKNIDTLNKKSNQNKNEKDKRILQLDYEIEKKLSKFDNQIKDKLKELTKIEVLVIKEQDKTKQPLKSFKQEELKLNRKKKNLDIIIRRFNKQFKEKFPLQDLKL